MVDEREILKQYSYKATSNLVLQQDRRRNREQDAAGVTALHAGSLSGRMGDKLNRGSEKSDEVQKRIEKRREKHDVAPQNQKRPRLNDVPLSEAPLAIDADVVDVADQLEINADGTAYVPTNAISQRAFEALLAFITSKLGDQPRVILQSVADETLVLLKDKNLIELDRKKHIEDILGHMDGDEFSRLSLLGRQISDFLSESILQNDQGIDSNPENVTTDYVGVAVLSDPEDNNSDDDEEAGTDEDAIEVVEVDHDADGVVMAPLATVGNMKEETGEQSIGNEEGSHVTQSLKSFDPRKVDAYWIQRQLSQFYQDAHECQKAAEEVLNVLITAEDDRVCEHGLVKLLIQFDKFDLISMLLENRIPIVWSIRLGRAKSVEEIAEVRQTMLANDDAKHLVTLLFHDDNAADAPKVSHEKVRVTGRGNGTSTAHAEGDIIKKKEESLLFGRRRPKFPLRTINLESISFQKGGNQTSVRECKLPDGSERIENKDYQEWHIPATSAVNNSSQASIISISDLPEWVQVAFPGTQDLNLVQSTVFPCAFESDENMLLCAPTGAGKTNVAMLTILRALQNAKSAKDANFSIDTADLKSMKIVYVAPMKALVAEVVDNLGKRLGGLGLKVRELTGDVSLSGREIDDTHVIVTTPEKWDIITRKGTEKIFTRLVKLLIVDEIHLLHDERGPVLEAIIARTLRDVDSGTLNTRVVGLSATLPNYKDVAAFLLVDPKTGLFHFSAAYRPCPLQQCYVGITAKKAFKRFQLMNEIAYIKVKAQLEASRQVIIFVHSRKETTATAQAFIDKAIGEEIIDLFLKPGSGSFEIIQSELAAVNGKELRTFLEHGVSIHHAGMTRKDRQLVEALFEAGHVKVLVSTATLAWGVNLPAHAVIIKGTQVYSPEHGRWTQLSSMDVMQMMGRAGRPQFDKFGEGVIITSKADVLYYLSLLNNQLPIESQMVSRLVDMLNAEVANGSVSSIVEGSEWLSFTYLYWCMLRNPVLYGIAADEFEGDPKLDRRRAELVHSAVMELHTSGLVRYNKKTGEVEGTEIGKVASDFYINHESMGTYMERMKECVSDIDLLRIFATSGEFQYMRVREEEKLELARLSERVPIPVKESLEESTAKVNVLLQAFVSNLSLDGLALRADMVYVTQSAARISRALLQLSFQLKKASISEKCLALCKSVSARQWSSQTPLRQFEHSLGHDVLHNIERKELPFERYYDLNISELGELLKNSKLGKTVHRLVHSLPRLEMDAQVRPLSRSMIEVELTLTPDFRFDRKIHGGGESFWVTVEDADSEELLHVEPFYLKGSLATVEHVLQFTLQLSTPEPPQYFIRCASDRWTVPDTVQPISFRTLLPPEKFAPHSKLLEMHPLSIQQAFQPLLSQNIDSESENVMAMREVLADAYKFFASHHNNFTPLQTQIFPTIFESDDDAVIATLPGIERDVCVELCIARLFTQTPASVAVWIVGKGAIAVDQRYNFLKNGLGNALGLNVGKFLFEGSDGMGLLRSSGTIVVTTGEQWDMFSRRCREKRFSKLLKKVGLIIFDNINLLSSKMGHGAAFEVVASRMRYIAADGKENGENPFRMVAISDPIANAREIGHWLGCHPSAVFSFHPKDLCKDFKLDVISGSFGHRFRESQAIVMSRSILAAMRKYIGEKNHQVMIYVSSRKVARNLAFELVNLLSQGGHVVKFLESSRSDIQADIDKLQNKSLRECVKSGVGFIYDGMNNLDKDIVENLFRMKRIRVLVAMAQVAWESTNLDCRLVIVAGTSSDDAGGVATRRMEYSRTDLMKMMFGMRDSRNSIGKRVAILLTEPALKEHYKNHCLEPFPVESQLPARLSDHLNAEIASGVVESKQDAVDYLTWTFFYRRLPKNANFYGMNGISDMDISNHLSEMVERSLSDLDASKCVAIEEEDDIGSLDLGIIASRYYVWYATVELFSSSVSSNTRQNGLLDILSMASEFETVPVRVGEEDTLQEMWSQARIGLQHDGGVVSFSSPHVKAHLLLQAHLSRQKLSGPLAKDQRKIVRTSIRLLRAMVDVICSAGWLKPAIAAIELSQMLVQAVWDMNLPLMQLPHIDKVRATMLKENFGVSEVFGIPDMEESERREALEGLSTDEVSNVASACLQFPSLEDFEIEQLETVVQEDGANVTKMVVNITRYDEDENGEGDGVSGKMKVPRVSAPRFPEVREEGWWVIVGDESTNNVFFVRHVALKKKAAIKVEFTPPSRAGKNSLQVFLMSDSYIDFDQVESLEIGGEDVNNANNDEKDATMQEEP